jgi:TPR repeat protein
MDIEELRKKAKKGDAMAQLELAHAYLNGTGVRKNHGHYLSWLTKSAEQENIEAQKELVKYYSSQKSFEHARYWVGRCKANGIIFSDEELIRIGDADKCKEKIEEYLFGNPIQFNKANDLILSHGPSDDMLHFFAEKYHEIHKNDSSRLNEISCLYLLSTNGDKRKINETALNLISKSEKDNMKIAVSLFQEGYRLGDHYAAASYMYCLIYGKGVRKDIKTAATIYYKFKDKGIKLTHAFASSKMKGKAIRIPKSMEWKKVVAKYYFSVLSTLPNDYWDKQMSESIHEESSRINEAVESGNIEAEDSLRAGGCYEAILSSQRVLYGYLGLFALILAAILGLFTGHIPNWLVYSIGFLFFFPSFMGLEGAVSCSALLVSYSLIGYTIYHEWSHISEFFAVFLIGFILYFPVSFLSMGFWFHYLVSIEWKYGSLKAFCFALITLGITLCGGYLLYQNGIIF